PVRLVRHIKINIGTTGDIAGKRMAARRRDGAADRGADGAGCAGDENDLAREVGHGRTLSRFGGSRARSEADGTLPIRLGGGAARRARRQRRSPLYCRKITRDRIWPIRTIATSQKCPLSGRSTSLSRS